MYAIYANIGGILMGSMLPHIAAPWIRHGHGLMMAMAMNLRIPSTGDRPLALVTGVPSALQPLVASRRPTCCQSSVTFLRAILGSKGKNIASSQRIKRQ